MRLEHCRDSWSLHRLRAALQVISYSVLGSLGVALTKRCVIFRSFSTKREKNQLKGNESAAHLMLSEVNGKTPIDIKGFWIKSPTSQLGGSRVLITSF